MWRENQHNKEKEAILTDTSLGSMTNEATSMMRSLQILPPVALQSIQGRAASTVITAE